MRCTCGWYPEVEEVVGHCDERFDVREALAMAHLVVEVAPEHLDQVQ